MSISDHALHEDFPEFRELIRELRKSDVKFKEMSDHYDKLDKSIRGLEYREVPTDDAHFNQLKLERAQLKDSLYTTLSKHGG
ncbi:DUF465 domain-containing protein [Marinobacter halodurans]|uniref:DUF465 domain-containing protein n=1 Tax=Marinobacter halodurans TaxID=2528979 RepID=A0ABY1ZKR1_9GAMM|nr:DUF465 domain-containing protein [Marinobacter halodurans]TBW55999.1 DUF465 domain-containing protein [Marinobacter halodurans]